MDNKQIIPTALGMSYEEIENLNDVRPYDFETERERKWYEIGLIDGAEAADVKNNKSKDTRPLAPGILTAAGWEKVGKISNTGFRKYLEPIEIYVSIGKEIKGV